MSKMNLTDGVIDTNDRRNAVNGNNTRPIDVKLDDTPYEKLQLTNEFMFAKVIGSNPELATELLRRIFPEIKIDRIAVPETEKVLKHYYINKGVRLDFYTMDQAGRRYDVEMQMVTNQNIRKRSRYYASMMDANELLKGADYDAIADHYVVFICTFDLFNLGRKKYSFRQRCDEETTLTLNDGTQRIFLNSKGTVGEVSPEMQRFLDYLEEGEAEKESKEPSGKRKGASPKGQSVNEGSDETQLSAVDSDDWFIRKLHQSVLEARKNETWRDEYMTSRDIERRGYLQGEKIGRAEEKRETALRMLEEGLDLELISKVVDLSPEELQSCVESFERKNKE